jgi:hypothetical protein
LTEMEAFLNKFWDLIRISRLFEDTSREREASVQKCGALMKISIIFEDFFREIKYIFSRIVVF